MKQYLIQTKSSITEEARLLAEYALSRSFSVGYIVAEEKLNKNK